MKFRMMIPSVVMVTIALLFTGYLLVNVQTAIWQLEAQVQKEGVLQDVQLKKLCATRNMRMIPFGISLLALVFVLSTASDMKKLAALDKKIAETKAKLNEQKTN